MLTHIFSVKLSRVSSNHKKFESKFYHTNTLPIAHHTKYILFFKLCEMLFGFSLFFLIYYLSTVSNPENNLKKCDIYEPNQNKLKRPSH